MKCPECRNDIPDGSLKCMYCGYPLSQQTQFVNNSDDYFYKNDYRQPTDYRFSGRRREFDHGQMRREDNAYYDYGAYNSSPYENYRKPNPVRAGNENNDETIRYLLIALLGVNLIDMFLIAAILLIL